MPTIQELLIGDISQKQSLIPLTPTVKDTLIIESNTTVTKQKLTVEKETLNTLQTITQLESTSSKSSSIFDEELRLEFDQWSYDELETEINCLLLFKSELLLLKESNPNRSLIMKTITKRTNLRWNLSRKLLKTVQTFDETDEKGLISVRDRYDFTKLKTQDATSYEEQIKSTPNLSTVQRIKLMDSKHSSMKDIASTQLKEQIIETEIKFLETRIKIIQLAIITKLYDLLPPHSFTLSLMFLISLVIITLAMLCNLIWYTQAGKMEFSSMFVMLSYSGVTLSVIWIIVSVRVIGDGQLLSHVIDTFINLRRLRKEVHLNTQEFIQSRRSRRRDRRRSRRVLTTSVSTSVTASVTTSTSTSVTSSTGLTS
ncbi:hypothetical protein WICPIJ_003746 [Wickerhamomyces pijperi]|uniref:Uncharacterized protein n=1 Tax=Wickerhamomyces pijperi TaxID=599730 RepID=A0A9P8Q921_WICPI|nr:hypothetical protein WICPIJ_003746 [Wickerhamomyces pijperi]